MWTSFPLGWSAMLGTGSAIGQAGHTRGRVDVESGSVDRLLDSCQLAEGLGNSFR